MKNARLLFQDPATDLMEGIIELHHYIMFFLFIVILFVVWQLLSIVGLFSQFSNTFLKTDYVRWGSKHTSLGSSYGSTMWDSQDWKNYIKATMLQTHNVVHGTAIEIIWTITPSVILLLISIPSFALLFTMDEIVEPLVTLKVSGHQWYWSYEYSDYLVNSENGETTTLGFDSYMIPESELKVGDLRLLEVDNAVVLPINTPIRALVTANDVLHSWAVPSLGVKIDAVPGRLIVKET